MWWPNHITAGASYGEMMSHIDCWSTLASMAGIKPPPAGEMKDDNGKPIYFDSIDNSAYILGQSPAFSAQVVDLYQRRVRSMDCVTGPRLHISIEDSPTAKREQSG